MAHYNANPHALTTRVYADYPCPACGKTGPLFRHLVDVHGFARNRAPAIVARIRDGVRLSRNDYAKLGVAPSAHLAEPFRRGMLSMRREDFESLPGLPTDAELDLAMALPRCACPSTPPPYPLCAWCRARL